MATSFFGGNPGEVGMVDQNSAIAHQIIQMFAGILIQGIFGHNQCCPGVEWASDGRVRPVQRSALGIVTSILIEIERGIDISGIFRAVMPEITGVIFFPHICHVVRGLDVQTVKGKAGFQVPMINPGDTVEAILHK